MCLPSLSFGSLTTQLTNRANQLPPKWQGQWNLPSSFFSLSKQKADKLGGLTAGLLCHTALKFIRALFNVETRPLLFRKGKSWRRNKAWADCWDGGLFPACVCPCFREENMMQLPEIESSLWGQRFLQKAGCSFYYPWFNNTSGTGAFATKSFIIERLVSTDLLVTWLHMQSLPGRHDTASSQH